MTNVRSRASRRSPSSAGAALRRGGRRRVDRRRERLGHLELAAHRVEAGPQLRRGPPRAVAAAAGSRRQQPGREGAHAEQARADVGADDRADLRHEHRLGAEDLAPALDEPLGLVGRLDVLDDPARRRPSSWRSRRYSTIRSNARPEVRTRSIGVICGLDA